MTRLFLYDDARARGFEPFALTRPVSELRAGAEIIRARWELAAGERAEGFVGAAHLANFEEGDAPSAFTGSTIPAGSVVANSRFVIGLDAALVPGAGAYASDGRVCAVRLSRDIDTALLADGSVVLDDLADADKTSPLAGRWLMEVWDLVGDLSVQLAEDIALLGPRFTGEGDEGREGGENDGAGGAMENATVIGRGGVYCETGAVIEPFVVFDASEGPILVRRGAHIASFTRIVGPCFIGRDAMIVGDAIRACSIGDVCKVRGEIAGSVMLGHSNKGHTGFVGSSYIGCWVNLGAGTTTSNLKNTYGGVQVWTPTGLRNTGLQFLGTLIGDHAKTGIGTMLTTGCVVGAGANIFGSSGAPKRVPPFAWGGGEPYDRFTVSKFIEVAERMMARRHVTLGDRGRRQLEDSFAASQTPSAPPRGGAE
ncbi:MAG: hypothetical protein H0T48_08850 [Gemmatimonadaceae bacterium]|nr:hypothetical protein [Gemmatimonadaceae bacterium]